MGFKPKSAQLETQLDNLTKTIELPPETEGESKMAKARRTPEYKSQMAAKGVAVKDKASPELVAAIQERVATLRKPDVMTADLSSVITQLQNIWEKLTFLDNKLTSVDECLRSLEIGFHSRPKGTGIPMADAYPKTVNGGHPVTPKGKVASFIEVPSVEQLLARAGAWKEKNGAPALVALVKQFGVRKIGEMTEEQRAQFMERLGD